MSDLTRTAKEAEQEAASQGLIVCRPEPNELFIDLDSAEKPQWTVDKLTEMKAYEIVQSILWTRSKSGNWHVRVKLTFDMSNEERIAWQAALGSDKVREYLSLMRCQLETEDPVLFFEKPNWKELTS